MKGGAFKLNMHPKDYFDLNPYRYEGKGGKTHEEKERSRSAPTDKKPFKFSSPGKSVCLIPFFFNRKIYSFFVARWK